MSSAPSPLPPLRLPPIDISAHPSRPPPSAASASYQHSASISSITNSSAHPSPVMSPNTTSVTTKNSSLQPSPDLHPTPLLHPDLDPIPPLFDLPGPIVSRKSSQSALSDALAQSKSPNLIRRLSSRASKFAAGRRRQPSITSRSRDHSAGPIMRRRSDSTNTAPDGLVGHFDSDSDHSDDLPDDPLGLGIDVLRAAAAASVTSAPLPTPSTLAGPVIPASLRQGTRLVKVTRKKKKTLTLVLDPDAAKVSWDRLRPHKSFYIDDLKAIRTGPDAQNYRQECGVAPHEAPRFFSLCYAVPDRSKGRAHKWMHLMADDDHTFDLWTATLDAVSKHRQDRMAALPSFPDDAVRAHWRIELAHQAVDRDPPPPPPDDPDETVDFVGFQRLCRSLHIHCAASHLRDRFTQADTTHAHALTWAEFKKFLKTMKKREEVRRIYRRLAADAERGLCRDEFLAFLRKHQHEKVDEQRAHWDHVFLLFARRPRKDWVDSEADPRIGESAFAAFIASVHNSPVEAPPAQYTLDRPMNEYFISSSHNTYLLGRQVAGQSSVEAYIAALTRGSRCVEVDCWNGSDGQPVVMHGRTLTSQIAFADVMSTISRYAFVKTSFPLWVSLEVHCNAAQQEIMARVIKETCGPALVTKPLEESMDHLPSPSQLQNRILIKVKQPQPLDEPTPTEPRRGRSRGNSLTSPQVRPALLDHAVGSLPSSASFSKLPPPSLSRRTTGLESLESPSSNTSDSEGVPDDAVRLRDVDRPPKTSNIVRVLGELGVYSTGIKFLGFDDPESKKCQHIFSFMEATFDKNTRTQEDKRALIRHNMRYMMRVYPNGWRFNSSNFDPLEFWRRGVQMVALNWQTYDLGMQMNDAMFASGTAQSGYVLKPEELREIKMLPMVPEEAGANHVKRERKRINFSIEMISAQQLMRPRSLPAHRSVDPYLEVEVCHSDDKCKDIKGVVGDGGLDASSKDGLSGIGSPHRRRTKIIPGNAFNPTFDDKLSFTLTTKHPDLVFVRFSVRYSPDGTTYSDRGQPLATYCAKLATLKHGYRTLPLYDGNGDQFLLSTLFCNIQVEPITSVYVDGPEACQQTTPTAPRSIKDLGRNLVFNRAQMSPRLNEAV